jgi:hypothetical protein
VPPSDSEKIIFPADRILNITFCNCGMGPQWDKQQDLQKLQRPWTHQVDPYMVDNTSQWDLTVHPC